MTQFTFQDLYDKYADLPRSERVTELFNFEPTDYQADLLDHHEGQDKTQAAPKKGRQVGASLVGSALAADFALWNPGETVLITAPMQDPADELFEKFTQHFKNSDLTLKQLGVVEDNKTEWRFSHGTRVMGRTLGQGELSQRGQNPRFVIVDEAAYASDYHLSEVIEPFFITHPSYEFYLFSTPLGKSGYFYQAVEGRNSDRWYSPHWPTEISPFADENYLERKREEKDSQSFAQEYLGEFVSSEDAYLPHEIVKPCINPDVDARPNALRYLGVDPAREGDDRLVLYDLDEDGVTRNIWSEETTSGTGFVGRIKALQNGNATDTPEYGDGDLPSDGYNAIVIEENAVGGFGADIVEEGLGGVIRKVRTGSQSKQDMYQRLKKDFEDGNLAIPNHRKLINQTTSLQYSYTQHGYLSISHPTGEHDDYPDALALANAIRSGLEITSGDAPKKITRRSGTKPTKSNVR